MPWPSLDEYFATLQNPDLCFADPRLTGGTVQPNTMGLPLIVCGQFAGVCRVDCGSGGVWAVRFFQSNRAGIRDRYQAISAHLRAHKSPIFATFEFVDDGIMVNGAWYPIVLMEWVAGESLLEHIAGLVKRRDTQGLRDLAERWVTLLQDLEALEVAHGDLQHGNIRVQSDGRLRLIDYDGMWVPALKGQQSLELGLADYQHPGRSGADYGPHLDRFSGLTILVALLALAQDIDLWPKDPDVEYILFRSADYKAPARSSVFKRVAKLTGKDPDLASYLATLIRWCGAPYSPCADWLPRKDPYGDALSSVQSMISAGKWADAQSEWTATLAGWTPTQEHRKLYADIKDALEQRQSQLTAMTQVESLLQQRKWDDAVRIWRDNSLSTLPEASRLVPGVKKAEAEVQRRIAQQDALTRFHDAIRDGRDEDALDTWNKGQLQTYPPAKAYESARDAAQKRVATRRRHRIALNQFLSQAYAGEDAEAVATWRNGDLDNCVEAGKHADMYKRLLAKVALRHYRSLAGSDGREQETVEFWEHASESFLKHATKKDRQLYIAAKRITEWRASLQRFLAAFGQRRWRDAMDAWDSADLGSFSEAQGHRDKYRTARGHLALNHFLQTYYNGETAEAMAIWEKADLGSFPDADPHKPKYEHAKQEA